MNASAGDLSRTAKKGRNSPSMRCKNAKCLETFLEKKSVSNHEHGKTELNGGVKSNQVTGSAVVVRNVEEFNGRQLGV